MDELKSNKLIWAVVAFTIINVLLFVAGKIVIDRTADIVIERLQKEYSPSPYGPGIDPDKINPDLLQQQKAYFQMRKSGEGTIQTALDDAAWRDQWERERNASN